MYRPGHEDVEPPRGDLEHARVPCQGLQDREPANLLPLGIGHRFCAVSLEQLIDAMPREGVDGGRGRLDTMATEGQPDQCARQIGGRPAEAFNGQELHRRDRCRE